MNPPRDSSRMETEDRDKLGKVLFVWLVVSLLLLVSLFVFPDEWLSIT